MRVLIVDDDPFFRTIVRKFFERDLPGAELVEYDPASSGRPGDDFDWSRYDVLLLDHGLGCGESGLDWVESLKPSRRLPPTIYLVDPGEEAAGARAWALGAHYVMLRREISGERLARLIADVIKRSGGSEAGAPASRGVGLSREAPPPIIDGYKFGSQIGAGAMSRVYLAERVADRLTVVLKVVDFDLVNNRNNVRRFVEEAELISELDSPYVVRIYEQGFTDDCGYLAMEFFPRGDLKQRIEHGIRPGDALHCLANIAYGLQAVHGVGIVHRDLKPANIMFRYDDSLALADFGISKRLEAQGEVAPTSVLGTPHYMSPEQGQGKPTDVRDDLYSLGVIFFEMLAGRKPFIADTPARLIYKHIHADVPRLPPDLRRYQEIVDRLLAKRAEERFQSASELLAAL